MGDRLQFLSRVTHAEGHSVSVETEIVRFGLDKSQGALSNTCVFTFVNVDADLVPRPVPPVYPTTYREDDRFLAAHRRRQAYLSWKSRR